jgi:hypothetical protein
LLRSPFAGQVNSSDGHRHFKLCFNAASVLDVIALSIQTRL